MSSERWTRSGTRPSTADPMQPSTPCVNWVVSQFPSPRYQNEYPLEVLCMKTLDAWIFGSWRISSEGLALYRIFVGLMILFCLMPPFSLYGYLGSLPSYLFLLSPGPIVLFYGCPSSITLLWLL